MKLSSAQQGILFRLLDNGGSYTFDGTRHQSFVALSSQGFITWTYKVVPEALHGRHQLWHVVTITDAGREQAYRSVSC